VHADGFQFPAGARDANKSLALGRDEGEMMALRAQNKTPSGSKVHLQGKTTIS